MSHRIVSVTRLDKSAGDLIAVCAICIAPHSAESSCSNRLPHVRVTPNRECERGSDRIFFRDFACKGVLALGGKGSPLG